MKSSRAWLIGVVAFLLAALLVGGCKASSTSSMTTTTTATTASAIPVIKLKFHSTVPPWAQDDAVWWWADQVEKRAGVKIEMEKFFNASLVQPADALDGLSKGIFDIGYFAPAYTPSKTPILNLPNSLPLITSDVGAAANLYIDLMKWASAKAEVEQYGVIFLFPSVTDSYQLMGNKRVQSLVDVKGYRARSFGLGAKSWAAIGGVPVTMTASEIFDAVQRGTVDGVLGGIEGAFIPLKVYEASKYMTYVNFGAQAFATGINKKKWDTIPPNVQKVMLDVGKEVPEQLYTILNNVLVKDLQTIKAKGIVIDTLSPADMSTIMQLGGQPVWNEAAQALEDKGLPGKQALAIMLKSARDYEAAHPRK